ncbi:response regulator transcription factor [Neptunicella sp.]|uniref:response regulator transcription factor n=1 Tax=Neptunicella sp. TaxID=2125986 RepID=UPI003F69244B
MTIYIVDDDAAFRESLVWLLEGAGHIVSAYESGEAFLHACTDNKDSIQGCLLLDVRMNGMSGLTLQQELNQRAITLPVIIVTGHADVAMAVQAMKNKAVDFIEKPFDDDKLLRLIDRILGDLSQQSTIEKQQTQHIERWRSLTKREEQVAQLVIAGRVNREIAEQLGISIKTVEIHRSRVMSKMQARNIAELIKQHVDLQPSI